MEEDEPSSAKEEDEDEEEEEEEEDKVGCKALSEYEKQRLSRIKENRARLEALGLPRLASSLLARAPSKPKQPGQEETSKRTAKKKKKKGDGRAGVDDEDDEYQPSDEGDGESSRSSEEEELDYRPSPSRPAPRGKGKKKDSLNAAKVRRSLYVKKRKIADVIDDDVALKQAIAISLGGITEDSVAVSAGCSQSSGVNVANASTDRRVDNASIQVAPAKRRKKGNLSRVQLSADEVVAYFFSFDEAGKGQITLRDLQRMAITHDFCWTDIEMANMIRCFDSNKDGKLSLDDFRTIVTRCNMLQEPTRS